MYRYIILQTCVDIVDCGIPDAVTIQMALQEEVLLWPLLIASDGTEAEVSSIMSLRNWKVSLSINISSLMEVHIGMLSGGAAIIKNILGSMVISIMTLSVTDVVMEDSGMETIRLGTLILGGGSAVVETVTVDVNVQGGGTMAWAGTNKSRTSSWELKMGIVWEDKQW